MKNHLEKQLSQIPSFQYVHEHLFTSGQPSAEQLQHIKEYGISTVINLALGDSPDHLTNEDHICLDLGLNYIQLPISWETPAPEQALFALDTIDFLVQTQSVWVHCAKNLRVSALVYLYRQYYMGMDMVEAQQLLEQVWELNETWTGLVHNVALQLQGRKATQELQNLCCQHN
ncbi:protein tyrosine phosphatase family protein [Acinetobacter rathckeae]|uniref:protein tyrosine phosphatase family protein n=1 Tax=Acinetobacter rathckeae TaxID=2605272 RepID=UPI0018A2ACA7|nr:protein tyrosine phosphatase family protein [Acinetobacter rathckeae]MBF7686978.1 protein tyrosine phosphatase family protein [Acinetobacter rathckeae]MBF7694618.1 protein tyrosine phosphatase family protein [Acinetobacter rathckeae]